MCQDLKCLFYVVEHRFYGDSQPFGDWSTANLKYLNSTQALADLKNFIVTTDAQLVEKYGGKPRKWVTIGGSYPGALSAWFNQQYPGVAAASWSSSGVILPIKDFTNFDLDIYTASDRSGALCPQVIKNITDYLEQAITDKLTPEDK